MYIVVFGRLAVLKHDYFGSANWCPENDRKDAIKDYAWDEQAGPVGVWAALLVPT